MDKPESQFFKDLLDNLYDGVYFVDADRKITYWNKGAERITGFTPGQVIGSSCADNILLHVDEQGNSLCATACPLVKIMREGGTVEAGVFLHHANGHRLPVLVRASPLLDNQGNAIGAVEIFSDNTAMFHAQQEMDELARAATLDALTGIANRRGVEQKLAFCISEYRQQRHEFAILFIDVDHFKQVNDRYGHDTGDAALRTIAATLKANLRASDYVGRWGGEEFLVILREINPAHLSRIAEKLRALVASSRVIAADGKPIRVTVSIGAALAQEHDTIESLLQRADQLLYRSKAEGRNRVTA
ncbi:MAG: sensor domain-containing diguanylate cyclase [Chloroflexi bacterium]|nr:sensor domain-containing diguanylate cyclase [Chloroflexota bacterium]